jgi:hypothetical protein
MRPQSPQTYTFEGFLVSAVDGSAALTNTAVSTSMARPVEDDFEVADSSQWGGMQ